LFIKSSLPVHYPGQSGLWAGHWCEEIQQRSRIFSQKSAARSNEPGIWADWDRAAFDPLGALTPPLVKKIVSYALKRALPPAHPARNSRCRVVPETANDSVIGPKIVELQEQIVITWADDYGEAAAKATKATLPSADAMLVARKNGRPLILTCIVPAF